MEVSDSFINKISSPGLQVIRSSYPMRDLCRLIYELGVVRGVTMDVFSSYKKEIKNTVISLVKEKCVNNATSYLERNWLEQEMDSQNAHGFFWAPEELNEYVENGSFWSGYICFHDEEWVMLANCSYKVILVDDISKLWWDGERELAKILPLVEKDAIEHRTAILVLASSYDDETNIQIEQI